MAKFLLTWDLDKSRIPTDPKERATLWGKLLGSVKRDLEEGIGKDWGIVMGESSGYFIVEGDGVEVSTRLQQYVPYVTFKTHPVMSVAESEEVLRNLSK